MVYPANEATTAHCEMERNDECLFFFNDMYRLLVMGDHASNVLCCSRLSNIEIDSRAGLQTQTRLLYHDYRITLVCRYQNAD